MPSTHLSLHYHLVFSTKHREPWITTAFRAELHSYLGGIVRGLDGMAFAVGGVADHVHLLVGLKVDQRLSRPAGAGDENDATHNTPDLVRTATHRTSSSFPFFPMVSANSASPSAFAWAMMSAARSTSSSL